MGDKCNSDGNASEGASAASVNEKGSRNKRKFLSDLSLEIPVDVSTLSLTEFPRYEILEEKLRKAMEELGSIMEIPDEDIEEREGGNYLLADWDDPIACQLEELLMSNLFTTFCTAVKKIIERGYTEEVATWAVLNSNMFHGSKDAVSNVVDGALSLLKREKEFHTPKYSVFEKLQSLVDYTLLEMVHVLREVRPSLTIAEAMWCLLMSDLNLLNSCVMDGNRIGASFGQEASEDNSLVSQLKAAASNSQNSQHKTAQSGASKRPPTSDLSLGKLAGRVNVKTNAHQETKGTVSSHGTAIDEKIVSSRKGSSSSTGRRDALRQKALQFEKNYKGRMSKGTLKAKVAAWGSMMLDKSLKAQSGSSGIVMKGTYTGTFTRLTAKDLEGHNNSSSTPKSEVPAGVVAAKDTVVALPAASSKSAVPSAADPKPSPKGRTSVSDTCKVIDYYASIPFDETLQKHVPRDDKDKTILMLVPHKQALEKELQSWTDWANNKVMQAARRLGKDQAELKMLRQEKEETEKFKKEKQTLEESTTKRLSEMEYALSNASGQIEIANCNARRLQEENSVLKKELETAILQAMRSANNVDEAMRKSQETMKKMQSWDAEKGLLQEQLNDIKRGAVGVEDQLRKARGVKDRFEVLFKQEESETQKVRDLINKLREKKAKDDSSTAAEEERIKQKAEKNLRKCEEDIKALQTMTAELRLEQEKSQIAALTEGYGSPGPQQSKLSKKLAALQDNLGGGDVKPERECVMCMTDEISVVFLPCCHQVLCSKCNDLHEKQGMKDCPSCRTGIQKRISVIYRDN